MESRRYTLQGLLLLATVVSYAFYGRFKSSEEKLDENGQSSVACIMFGDYGCMARCSVLCTLYECESTSVPKCEDNYCNCHRKSLTGSSRNENDLVFRKSVLAEPFFQNEDERPELKDSDDRYLQNPTSFFLRAGSTMAFDDTRDFILGVISNLKTNETRKYLANENSDSSEQDENSVLKNIGFTSRRLLQIDESPASVLTGEPLARKVKIERIKKWRKKARTGGPGDDDDDESEEVEQQIYPEKPAEKRRKKIKQPGKENLELIEAKQIEDVPEINTLLNATEGITETTAVTRAIPELSDENDLPVSDLVIENEPVALETVATQNEIVSIEKELLPEPTLMEEPKAPENFEKENEIAPEEKAPENFEKEISSKNEIVPEEKAPENSEAEVSSKTEILPVKPRVKRSKKKPSNPTKSGPRIQRIKKYRRKNKPMVKRKIKKRKGEPSKSDGQASTPLPSDNKSEIGELTTQAILDGNNSANEIPHTSSQSLSELANNNDALPSLPPTQNPILDEPHEQQLNLEDTAGEPLNKLEGPSENTANSPIQTNNSGNQSVKPNMKLPRGSQNKPRSIKTNGKQTELVPQTLAPEKNAEVDGTTPNIGETEKFLDELESTLQNAPSIPTNIPNLVETSVLDNKSIPSNLPQELIKGGKSKKRKTSSSKPTNEIKDGSPKLENTENQHQINDILDKDGGSPMIPETQNTIVENKPPVGKARQKKRPQMTGKTSPSPGYDLNTKELATTNFSHQPENNTPQLYQSNPPISLLQEGADFTSTLKSGSADTNEPSTNKRTKKQKQVKEKAIPEINDTTQLDIAKIKTQIMTSDVDKPLTSNSRPRKRKQTRESEPENTASKPQTGNTTSTVQPVNDRPIKKSKKHINSKSIEPTLQESDSLPILDSPSTVDKPPVSKTRPKKRLQKSEDVLSIPESNKQKSGIEKNLGEPLLDSIPSTNQTTKGKRRKQKEITPEASLTVGDTNRKPNLEKISPNEVLTTSNNPKKRRHKLEKVVPTSETATLEPIAENTDHNERKPNDIEKSDKIIERNPVIPNKPSNTNTLQKKRPKLQKVLPSKEKSTTLPKLEKSRCKTKSKPLGTQEPIEDVLISTNTNLEEIPAISEPPLSENRPKKRQRVQTENISGKPELEIAEQKPNSNIPNINEPIDDQFTQMPQNNLVDPLSQNDPDKILNIKKESVLEGPSTNDTNPKKKRRLLEKVPPALDSNTASGLENANQEPTDDAHNSQKPIEDLFVPVDPNTTLTLQNIPASKEYSSNDIQPKKRQKTPRKDSSNIPESESAIYDPSNDIPKTDEITKHQSTDMLQNNSVDPFLQNDSDTAPNMHKELVSGEPSTGDTNPKKKRRPLEKVPPDSINNNIIAELENINQVPTINTENIQEPSEDSKKRQKIVKKNSPSTPELETPGQPIEDQSTATLQNHLADERMQKDIGTITNNTSDILPKKKRPPLEKIPSDSNNNIIAGLNNAIQEPIINIQNIQEYIGDLLIPANTDASHTLENIPTNEPKKRQKVVKNNSPSTPELKTLGKPIEDQSAGMLQNNIVEKPIQKDITQKEPATEELLNSDINPKKKRRPLEKVPSDSVNNTITELKNANQEPTIVTQNIQESIDLPISANIDASHILENIPTNDPKKKQKIVKKNSSSTPELETPRQPIEDQSTGIFQNNIADEPMQKDINAISSIQKEPATEEPPNSDINPKKKRRPLEKIPSDSVNNIITELDNADQEPTIDPQNVHESVNLPIPANIDTSHTSENIPINDPKKKQKIVKKNSPSTPELKTLGQPIEDQSTGMVQNNIVEKPMQKDIDTISSIQKEAATEEPPISDINLKKKHRPLEKIPSDSVNNMTAELNNANQEPTINTQNIQESVDLPIPANIDASHTLENTPADDNSSNDVHPKKKQKTLKKNSPSTSKLETPDQSTGTLQNNIVDIPMQKDIDTMSSTQKESTSEEPSINDVHPKKQCQPLEKILSGPPTLENANQESAINVPNFQKPAGSSNTIRPKKQQKTLEKNIPVLENDSSTPEISTSCNEPTNDSTSVHSLIEGQPIQQDQNHSINFPTTEQSIQTTKLESIPDIDGPSNIGSILSKGSKKLLEKIPNILENVISKPELELIDNNPKIDLNQTTPEGTAGGTKLDNNSTPEDNTEATNSINKPSKGKMPLKKQEQTSKDYLPMDENINITAEPNSKKIKPTPKLKNVLNGDKPSIRDNISIEKQQQEFENAPTYDPISTTLTQENNEPQLDPYQTAQKDEVPILENMSTIPDVEKVPQVEDSSTTNKRSKKSKQKELSPIENSTSNPDLEITDENKPLIHPEISSILENIGTKPDKLSASDTPPRISSFESDDNTPELEEVEPHIKLQKATNIRPTKWNNANPEVSTKNLKTNMNNDLAQDLVNTSSAESPSTENSHSENISSTPEKKHNADKPSNKQQISGVKPTKLDQTKSKKGIDRVPNLKNEDIAANPSSSNPLPDEQTKVLEEIPNQEDITPEMQILDNNLKENDVMDSEQTLNGTEDTTDSKNIDQIPKLEEISNVNSKPLVQETQQKKQQKGPRKDLLASKNTISDIPTPEMKNFDDQPQKDTTFMNNSPLGEQVQKLKNMTPISVVEYITGKMGMENCQSEPETNGTLDVSKIPPNELENLEPDTEISDIGNTNIPISGDKPTALYETNSKTPDDISDINTTPNSIDLFTILKPPVEHPQVLGVLPAPEMQTDELQEEKLPFNHRPNILIDKDENIQKMKNPNTQDSSIALHDKILPKKMEKKLKQNVDRPISNEIALKSLEPTSIAQSIPEHDIVNPSSVAEELSREQDLSLATPTNIISNSQKLDSLPMSAHKDKGLLKDLTENFKPLSIAEMLDGSKVENDSQETLESNEKKSPSQRKKETPSDQEVLLVDDENVEEYKKPPEFGNMLNNDTSMAKENIPTNGNPEIQTHVNSDEETLELPTPIEESPTVSEIDSTPNEHGSPHEFPSQSEHHVVDESKPLEDTNVLETIDEDANLDSMETSGEFFSLNKKPEKLTPPQNSILPQKSDKLSLVQPDIDESSSEFFSFKRQADKLKPPLMELPEEKDFSPDEEETSSDFFTLKPKPSAKLKLPENIIPPKDLDEVSLVSNEEKNSPIVNSEDQTNKSHANNNPDNEETSSEFFSLNKLIDKVKPLANIAPVQETPISHNENQLNQNDASVNPNNEETSSEFFSLNKLADKMKPLTNTLSPHKTPILHNENEMNQNDVDVNPNNEETSSEFFSLNKLADKMKPLTNTLSPQEIPISHNENKMNQNGVDVNPNNEEISSEFFSLNKLVDKVNPLRNTIPPKESDKLNPRPDEERTLSKIINPKKLVAKLEPMKNTISLEGLGKKILSPHEEDRSNEFFSFNKRTSEVEPPKNKYVSKEFDEIDYSQEEEQASSELSGPNKQDDIPTENTELFHTAQRSLDEKHTSSDEKEISSEFFNLNKLYNQVVFEEFEDKDSNQDAQESSENEKLFHEDERNVDKQQISGPGEEGASSEFFNLNKLVNGFKFPGNRVLFQEFENI